MTTIEPHLVAADSAADRADGFFTGLAAWITTTDHKLIGRLYISFSLLLLVAAGAIAALLGFERIDATADALSSGAMPQLFSLYRVVLTFGVLVPLGLGLAVAVVPLQLGARALALPRLAVAGFWAWLAGMVMVIVSIVGNGGPGGGNATMVDLFLCAHVLVALGLIATAGSVATSIITTRAPGMNMRRVPLFAWGALIGTIGLLVILPALVGTLILLALDHHYARNTFGGNMGIGTWVGFAFSQPATYVYAVPVFGFAAEAVATATRKRLPMRGVALIGIGLAGSGFIAAVSLVSADLRVNIKDASFSTALTDILPFALFYLVPLLGPLLVLAVVGLALKSGRPRISAAFVAGILSAGMVFTGMVATVLLHIGDAHLTGTVFEEGTWLYCVYGTVIAAFGAISYWGPKLTGRMIDAKKVIPLVGLAFIATVLAALPMLIAGFAKQPANATIFDYSGPQNLWNTVSTAGHALMVVTVLAFVGLALQSFTKGEAAGDDPFDGQTLEWATTSPPPANNFAEIHAISSAEPLLDLKPATTAPEGTA
ncbi:MAG: cbb3-type cytochrome c oxidase subunit I [Actinomycetota bacterium]